MVINRPKETKIKASTLQLSSIMNMFEDEVIKFKVYRMHKAYNLALKIAALVTGSFSALAGVLEAVRVFL